MLKLPIVAIEIPAEGEYQVLSEYPPGAAFDGETQTYPLVYESEVIGQLRVGLRAADEPFRPAEEQLLRNIARQASTAVHVDRLSKQLQHSREKLVSAREDERRRLRRDLHDGLGPQLATITVKAEAAANLLENDAAASEQLLAEIKAESQGAVQEIRRVVNGLWPATLDQLGLVSALGEYAFRNSNGELQIRIQAPDDLPPLPAAAELAAYRIAIEAMTNVSRHAKASLCTVHLSVDETLFLEVDDDGVGLPAIYRAGVGLSSMRERTAELGGTLLLESKPGQGTRLSARLPLSEIE